MMIAIMVLALSGDGMGFEDYINQLGVPKVSIDEQQINSRCYTFQKDGESPVFIRAEVTEIESAERGALGFKNKRQFMVQPDQWDAAPRQLLNGNSLGIETRTGHSESEAQVYAYGNHCTITVRVRGVLVKGKRKGEVVLLPGSPGEKAEIAENVATLFIAEQEAYSFSRTEATLGGKQYPALQGLDGTNYISVHAYTQANSLAFSIDPNNGIGMVATSPALTFCLGSKEYRIGQDKYTARHIVVLQDGTAYIPEEMLRK